MNDGNGGIVNLLERLLAVLEHSGKIRLWYLIETEKKLQAEGTEIDIAAILASAAMFLLVLRMFLVALR